MAFLTLIAAGIDLPMASFRRRPDVVRGEVARAFDNTLLPGTDLPKREWEGETIELAPADADAIRAAITGGPVQITGEKLRGQVAAVLITVEGEDSAPYDADSFEESLNLLFREV